MSRMKEIREAVCRAVRELEAKLDKLLESPLEVVYAPQAANAVSWAERCDKAESEARKLNFQLRAVCKTNYDLKTELLAAEERHAFALRMKGRTFKKGVRRG